jgi:addiction module RelB/DinJ family antitoxin
MKTTLYTKIDKEVKDQAQDLAKELGLPLSVVINTQLKEFVRVGELKVSREPQLKDEVLLELIKVSKDAREGKNVSPEFNNVDDAMKWLNS